MKTRLMGRFIRKGIGIFPYFLFLIIMIGIVSAKTNYHVDELLSYGLSNSATGTKLEVEDGFRYENSRDPFYNYLTVDSDNRFNYEISYTNQKLDVHPPLYYAVLHTICSFFPGVFSKWFAGTVNIIFALATLYFFRKLTPYFCRNKLFCELLSYGFILSAGILQNITFFRMYVMAMFWVIYLCYLYVSRIEEKFDWKFLLQVFLVVMLGALTHYYCIVFSVLLSVSFGVYLLVRKQWLNIVKLCGVTFGAGGISYLIFPSMITHMFSGYRGTESMDNLTNMSDYRTRLESFYKLLDQQMFGKYLSVFIVLLLLIPICNLIIRNSGSSNTEEPKTNKNIRMLESYIVVSIPVLLYFLLVSKMAVFVTDRYMFPIYAITFLLAMSLLLNTLDNLLNPRNHVLVCCILIAFVAVSSSQNNNWMYLYTDKATFLQKVSQYSETDCICVYENTWQITPMLLEAEQYRSITFVQKDNTEMIDQLIENTEGPIVLTTVRINNETEYVNYFVENADCINSNQKIGNYAYSTSYYLS